MPHLSLPWGLLTAPAEIWGMEGRDFAFAAVKVLPCAALVAGWGLRPLPLALRATFGALLLATATPSLVVVNASRAEPLLWLSQALSGLPIALSTSAALWCATMTGNLLDDLRGPAAPPQIQSSNSEASPLGYLLCLGAAMGFLQLGGPGRIASALRLTNPPPFAIAAHAFQPAVQLVLHGISVALAIGGPLIAIRLLAGVLEAILTRLFGFRPAITAFSSLTSLAHLTVIALLLDRIVERLTLVLDGSF